MTSFLLVHGSWHGAWCGEKLVPFLDGVGHALLVTLTTGHSPFLAAPTELAERLTALASRLLTRASTGRGA